MGRQAGRIRTSLRAFAAPLRSPDLRRVAAAALLALPREPWLAVAVLVLGGSGYTLSDVAGRTLLQRVVPDEVLARVFGLLEGIQMAALAAGAVLAPALQKFVRVHKGARHGGGEDSV